MRRVMLGPLNPAARAASQSDQETATNSVVFVSPSTQHFHPTAPKSLGLIQATATQPVLITGLSFNVASVSGPASGVLNIVFTNHMSTSNHMPFAQVITTSGVNRFAYAGNLTSGGFTVFIASHAGGLVTDWLYVSFGTFGDLP